MYLFIYFFFYLTTFLTAAKVKGKKKWKSENLCLLSLSHQTKSLIKDSDRICLILFIYAFIVLVLHLSLQELNHPFALKYSRTF